LLWLDIKVSVQDADTCDGFTHLFDVHRYRAIASLETEIARIRPMVICFDFDFPTKQGLQALQNAKQAFPHLPIIMLTVQHSEALAVWAFRSRVWDYLVKPVAKRDLERCLFSLNEMLSIRELQPRPRQAVMPASLIPEENRVAGERGHAPLKLAPAIGYVESNYAGKISSANAAALCRLTTFQLSRLFKETYGLTFQEYVLRFRIRQACRLLKNPNAQIVEISHLVGFNDPSYFGKMFRRYMNC
jgi:YesN/AraC family two-component response regulator